jgi:hypothetical protein
LKRIDFDYNLIAKIGNDAFSDLNNLNVISLKNIRIDSIVKSAFHFKKNSKNKLQIDLQVTNLNGSSFELGSFNSLNSPSEIYAVGIQSSHI